MPRLKNFTIVFVVMTILFFLFNQIPMIDTLVMASFILGSVFLIFTREEKPTEGFDDPKVHYYQRSRINYYGYVLVTAASIISFSFFAATKHTNIRIGLITLVLWAVLIVVTYIVGKIESKNLLKLALSDYVFNYYDYKYPISRIDELTKWVLTLNKFDQKSIEQIIRKHNDRLKIKEEDIVKTSKLYVNYILALQDEQITSDEVKEMEN